MRLYLNKNTAYQIRFRGHKLTISYLSLIIEFIHPLYEH